MPRHLIRRPMIPWALGKFGVGISSPSKQGKVKLEAKANGGLLKTVFDFLGPCNTGCLS